MNHEAIYVLYPNVVSIDDVAGAFDKDGNKIQIDINLVNSWIDPNQYKYQRATEYPAITDQLDMLYHDIKNGTLETGNWIQSVEAVKQKYPKPE